MWEDLCGLAGSSEIRSGQRCDRCEGINRATSLQRKSFPRKHDGEGFTRECGDYNERDMADSNSCDGGRVRGVEQSESDDEYHDSSHVEQRESGCSIRE